MTKSFGRYWQARRTPRIGVRDAARTRWSRTPIREDSCEKCGHVITGNLRYAFGELDRLKYNLAASDAVIANAAYIYRNALAKDLARGRSISALAASALYAACRNTETPRTLKDMEQASNIRRKDIARCYRLLLRELNLKVP